MKNLLWTCMLTTGLLSSALAFGGEINQAPTLHGKGLAIAEHNALHHATNFTQTAFNQDSNTIKPQANAKRDIAAAAAVAAANFNANPSKMASAESVSVNLSLEEKNNRIYAKLITTQQKSEPGQLTVQWLAPTNSGCHNSKFNLAFQNKKFHTQAFRTILLQSGKGSHLCAGTWQVKILGAENKELASSSFEIKSDNAINTAKSDETNREVAPRVQPTAQLRPQAEQTRVIAKHEGFRPVIAKQEGVRTAEKLMMVKDKPVKQTLAAKQEVIGKDKHREKALRHAIAANDAKPMQEIASSKNLPAAVTNPGDEDVAAIDIDDSAAADADSLTADAGNLSPNDVAAADVLESDKAGITAESHDDVAAQDVATANSRS